MFVYEECCERAVRWMAEAAAADKWAIECQRAGWPTLALSACQQAVMARNNYRYWIKQAEREL